MRFVLILAGMASSAFAQAPSGLDWALQEVIFEPADAAPDARDMVRLRYLSDPLSDTTAFSYEQIEADFMHYCQGDGLAQMRQSAPNATQIIISVASGKLAFGETAPEIVQYFEAFRPEGDVCIWDDL